MLVVVGGMKIGGRVEGAGGLQEAGKVEEIVITIITQRRAQIGEDRRPGVKAAVIALGMNLGAKEAERCEIVLGVVKVIIGKAGLIMAKGREAGLKGGSGTKGKGSRWASSNSSSTSSPRGGKGAARRSPSRPPQESGWDQVNDTHSFDPTANDAEHQQPVAAAGPPVQNVPPAAPPGGGGASPPSSSGKGGPPRGKGFGDRGLQHFHRLLEELLLERRKKKHLVLIAEGIVKLLMGVGGGARELSLELLPDEFEKMFGVPLDVREHFQESSLLRFVQRFEAIPSTTDENDHTRVVPRALFQVYFDGSSSWQIRLHPDAPCPPPSDYIEYAAGQVAKSLFGPRRPRTVIRLENSVPLPPRAAAAEANAGGAGDVKNENIANIMSLLGSITAAGSSGNNEGGGQDGEGATLSPLGAPAAHPTTTTFGLSPSPGRGGDTSGQSPVGDAGARGKTGGGSMTAKIRELLAKRKAKKDG
ncbi:hypothetical protein FOZ60_002025 [Perkinsus olseni]|uniref:Uncharacterized protein n=2 Tax=Perkinsus olseni TaxID=32597 RepID=A0A7J6NZ49_PEROL|nr:hypothetical protein FOZ60_002025 [Perkinsus olseni]